MLKTEVCIPFFLNCCDIYMYEMYATNCDHSQQRTALVVLFESVATLCYKRQICRIITGHESYFSLFKPTTKFSIMECLHKTSPPRLKPEIQVLPENLTFTVIFVCEGVTYTEFMNNMTTIAIDS